MCFSVRQADVCAGEESALYGKAHSAPAVSRKSAFCSHHLTEKHSTREGNRGGLHVPTATAWRRKWQ